MAKSKGPIKTGKVKGRYPVFNTLKSTEVKLQNELAFEADMRISLINHKEGLFGVDSNVIGEFAVPV